MLREAASAVTRAGWSVLVSAVVAYPIGWWFGWIEFMLLSAGLVLAIVIAVGFVVGRLRLRMERSVEPDRVAVGKPSFALLRVANDRLAPTSPVQATDWVGTDSVPIDIPALPPGANREMIYPLPTGRRGVVNVGPVIIARADPLGLLRREASHGERQRLWIHPETVSLPPLPAGFSKDLEGPTSDMSPKGDVVFHTLREYVHGDEYRHIHWKSSARLGTMMVRQYVDNRRPHLTVVLDTRPDTYTDDSFELAVSCAASLALLEFTDGQSASAYCGDSHVVGELVRASRDSVLDRFAAVERLPSDAHIARTVTADVSRERATSTTVLVSGALPSQEVVAVGAAMRAVSRLMVARSLTAGDRSVPSYGGVEVLNFTTLREFRGVWLRALR